MKIFNWVNKKFSSKDGRCAKKDEFMIAKEMDRKPLIENVGLDDLIIDVDWKDNLLAIGTLGFDQFHKFIPDDDYFNHLFPYHQNDNQESDNDHDEYPAQELFHDKNNEDNFNSLLPLKYDRIKSIDGSLEALSINENIVDYCGINNKKEEKDCKKKKVTLAELFSAENVEEMKGFNEKDKTIVMMSKTTAFSKHNKLLSSGKKLIIPGVARVDARLLHKLNQMVTRMLKRKIHPDPVSQGKHQKDNNKHNKNSIFGHQLSVKQSINETVSLLRTQDVEI